MNVTTMYNLLDKYGHETTENGCLTIISEWDANKRPITELLSRHPQWNKERLAIVFNAGWTRSTDAIQVGRFFTWIERTHGENINLNYVRMATIDAVDETTDGSAKVTDALACAINDAAPDARAVAGQKVSRAIGKLCKTLHIDKSPDYNRQFALFAGACASHTITAPTVLSVNPMDYLTMSFGNGWRSCQTIDRENRRSGGGDGYGGCYCSGTLSYMLDGASVVCFTLRTMDDLYDYEADKITRCMMHTTPDGSVIVQGRVYPQANDSDDTGIYAQYRAIMQDVIATCAGAPSLWSIKKGTEECAAVIDSDGTHYRDYLSFSACNVSRMKNRDTEHVHMRVGHNPICPSCGCEHDNEKSLCCDDCEGGCTCERCGASIDLNGDYECIDGYYYCDCGCAYDDGYRFCADVEEWHNENDCYYDDYENEWFYVTSDMVTTEDGYTYRNMDNAYSAGYARTEDGEWYPEDDVIYCEHCDSYVRINEYNTDADACTCCAIDITAGALADVLTENGITSTTSKHYYSIDHSTGTTERAIYHYGALDVSVTLAGVVYTPYAGADAPELHYTTYNNYHNYLLSLATGGAYTGGAVGTDDATSYDEYRRSAAFMYARRGDYYNYFIMAA